MAKSIHLYTQNTAGWGRYNSEFLATVKAVKSKVVRQDDDIDGRIETVYHLRLPVALKGLGKGALWNSLDDVFSQRCYHEFDCCGCYFGGVNTVKVKGRKVMFRTSYSRNL